MWIQAVCVESSACGENDRGFSAAQEPPSRHRRNHSRSPQGGKCLVSCRNPASSAHVLLITGQKYPDTEFWRGWESRYLAIVREEILLVMHIYTDHHVMYLHHCVLLPRNFRSGDLAIPHCPMRLLTALAQTSEVRVPSASGSVDIVAKIRKDHVRESLRPLCLLRSGFTRCLWTSCL